MLSRPIPLRLLLAAQPKLVTPLLQVVHRVITRPLLGQAGLKPDEADSGAVTLIQRFGLAANLNIHLHCLVLDGLYRMGADGVGRDNHSVRAAMRVDAVHSSGTCGNWLRPRERDKWLELARGWLLAFGPNPSPSSCFDPSESQYWPEPASPERTVGSEISGACALLRPPCPLRSPLRQGSGHRPAPLDARPRLAWERHGSPGPVGAAPCRPPWPVRCC